MKVGRVAILLTWYFAILSGPGTGRVVGSFPDKVTCEAVRKEFEIRAMISVTSPCWSSAGFLR